MIRSENIDKLAPALVALQAEIRAVAKNAYNPHHKATYTDLATLWTHVQGTLAEHKFAVIQTFDPGEPDRVTITTTLMHTSGQYIYGTLTLPLGRGGGPQGAGSAITYGRRYSLAAILGVVSEDDDDGNAAQKSVQKPPKANEKDSTGDEW